MLSSVIAIMKLAAGEIIVGNAVLAYLDFLEIPFKLGFALGMYHMKVWAGYGLLGFFCLEILIDLYRSYDYYGDFTRLDLTWMLLVCGIWIIFAILALQGLKEYQKHLHNNPDTDPVLGYE